MSYLEPDRPGVDDGFAGEALRDYRAFAGNDVEDTYDRFLRWVTVCGVSAAPTFLLGHSAGWHPYGMVCGVACFVVLYTCITSHAWFRELDEDSWPGRTLRVVYGTRIAMSILFPIAWFVDGWCGAVSVELLDRFYLNPSGQFGRSFVFTLTQGVVINLVLVLYAVPIGCWQYWSTLRASAPSPRGRPRRSDPVAWHVAAGVAVALAAMLWRGR